MIPPPVRKQPRYLGVGIAIGVAIGAGLGVALGNMAFMGVGIAIGVALGFALSRSTGQPGAGDDHANPADGDDGKN